MSSSMSEGMSGILIPNQRPEQRSQKRSRVEDLDSGGSTGRSRCRYHGCGRPLRRGREFCGRAHTNFFMANLADDEGAAGSFHVKGQQQMNGTCMLPSCGLAVGVESTTGHTFDFCIPDHYDAYVEICTPHWAKKGRLCKLQGCINHVWVDETPKKCHKLCGKKCRKLFYGRRGLSSLDEKGPSCNEIPKESTPQEASEQQDEREKVKKKLGYHAKSSVRIEYMEKCLKHVVLHLRDPSENFCRGIDISEYLDMRDLEIADPSKNLCTGKDIPKSHPWELNDSKGDEARYFLLMYDSKQKNERTTTQGFAWKQDGPKYPGKVQSRYLHYEYRGKPDASNYHLGDHIVVYRRFEAKKKREEKEEKKRRKKRGETGGETRWKDVEYFLSDDAIAEVTGEYLPRYRPMIWKIFEDKEGKPLWPPTGQDQEETPAIDRNTEDGNAVLSVGNIPDQGGRVTSSSSSELPQYSDLPPGRETFMSSNPNETGRLNVPTFWHDGTTLTPESLLNFFDDIFKGCDDTVDMCNISPPLGTSEQLFLTM